MAKQKDVIREVLYELYIALHKKPLPVTPSKKHSLAFDKDNIAKMRGTRYTIYTNLQAYYINLYTQVH